MTSSDPARRLRAGGALATLAAAWPASPAARLAPTTGNHATGIHLPGTGF
jgi:hypothetical protein